MFTHFTFDDLLVVLSVDRIILSFRKPFLSFYIYLLLIWLCLFLFFILLSNDRTTSCSKSWDHYHFGSAGISVDFYVYVPINTYRCVENNFSTYLSRSSVFNCSDYPSKSHFYGSPLQSYVDISTSPFKRFHQSNRVPYPLEARQ